METYWDCYEKPVCIKCGYELAAPVNVCVTSPCPNCGYPRPMGDCSDL